MGLFPEEEIFPKELQIPPTTDDRRPPRVENRAALLKNDSLGKQRDWNIEDQVPPVSSTEHSSASRGRGAT